jgi:hypothetical protein
MTPTQLVALFVRLFALWLVISAIQALGTAMAMHDALGRASLASYLLAGLLLLVALALWRHPLFVARTLIPSAPAEPGGSITAFGAATVGCIVLGLWVLVARALPALTRDILIVEVLRLNDQPLQAMQGRDLAHVIESVLDVCAALLLMFKARTIAGYLLRPRDSGGASS